METVITYLTEPLPGFGPLAAGFLGLQIAALLAGMYLAFFRQDPHALRGPALRRLGYAGLTLGALAVAVGVLRLSGVSPFSARYWFYAVAALELALIVSALVYWQTTYRAQVSALASSKGRQRASPATLRSARAPGLPTNGQSNAINRLQPTGGVRRESRRDRKRRKH